LVDVVADELSLELLGEVRHPCREASRNTTSLKLQLAHELGVGDGWLTHGRGLSC